MTTQGTLDSLLVAIQLQGPQSLIGGTESAEANEACSVTLPEPTGLWTDGLPDPAKIKLRMEQLAQEFVNKRYIRITTGQYQYPREIKERKQAEAAFYGEMHYLEDLLYTTPAVLSLQPSSTTTIVPYVPRPRRRPGRPSTGGRRPKPTTRSARTRSEDTDY